MSMLWHTVTEKDVRDSIRYDEERIIVERSIEMDITASLHRNREF